MVDNQLPFIDGEMFASDGFLALIEKAYAKLRYCYKGLLGIGTQQLIL